MYENASDEEGLEGDCVSDLREKPSSCVTKNYRKVTGGKQKRGKPGTERKCSCHKFRSMNPPTNDPTAVSKDKFPKVNKSTGSGRRSDQRPALISNCTELDELHEGGASQHRPLQGLKLRHALGR